MNTSKNNSGTPEQKEVSSEIKQSTTANSSNENTQTNEYLVQLLQHTQQLSHTVQDQAKRLAEQQRSSKMFLRKMATEVPPVVLAVLLAFGINSWWQQRKAKQLAVQSLANIITETRANLALYERVLRLDQRNLKRLNQQISSVRAENIYLDSLYESRGGRGYGEGINTFIMQEGAWQAATLTGGIENFDPELVQDASEMYSKIHFRNVDHAEFKFEGYRRYQEETLLVFLLENRSILLDHIGNCQSDVYVIREFLEKYDPTFKLE